MNGQETHIRLEWIQKSQRMHDSISLMIKVSDLLHMSRRTAQHKCKEIYYKVMNVSLLFIFLSLDKDEDSVI